MAKFDAEDLLSSILTMMTASLNTKIAEVEAEKVAKGVPITLAAVASDAYYLQTWTDKMLNHCPAIFYGIEDTETIAQGGLAAIRYKVFVEVVIADSGNDLNIVKRVLRYSRALQELFESKFANVAEFGQIKIETIRPMAFKLDTDTNDDVKVGGISLTLTLV